MVSGKEKLAKILAAFKTPDTVIVAPGKHTHMSVCLSVCLSVSIYLSVCLSVCLCVCVRIQDTNVEDTGLQRCEGSQDNFLWGPSKAQLFAPICGNFSCSSCTDKRIICRLPVWPARERLLRAL